MSFIMKCQFINHGIITTTLCFLSLLHQNGEPPSHHCRLMQYKQCWKSSVLHWVRHITVLNHTDFKSSAFQNNPAFSPWPDIHYNFTAKFTILQQCYNLEVSFVNWLIFKACSNNDNHKVINPSKLSVARALSWSHQRHNLIYCNGNIRLLKISSL